MALVKTIALHITPKDILCFFGGTIGSWITYLYGGWNEGMSTLVTLMAFDYITGLLVAGFFKKSAKTAGGGLSSKVGYKGLVKKFVMLIIVAAMYRVDRLLALDYLMNLAIIGFVLNELISLTENAGLMGIPLPAAVIKSIEILKQKANGGNENV